MERAHASEGGPRRAPAWVPITAWGFGLICVALGAAGIVGLQADAASRSLGSLAVVIGIAALLWGGGCLARGRVVAERAAFGGVLGGIGVAVALLSTPPGRASIFAVALLLGLGVVVACGMVHARRRPPGRDRVWGLIASAAVVTLLVVPALNICQGAALLDIDGTVAPIVGHEGH